MKERGQSLVELAISFVLLMTLLAGAVEFSIAFFQFVQLRDAAQEGAIYGSMNPTETQDIENRARGSSSSPIELSGSEVKFEISYSDFPCEGSYVITDENDIDTTYYYSITIKMDYDHKVFMPFLSAIIETIPLHAEVTDTILAPVCQ